MQDEEIKKKKKKNSKLHMMVCLHQVKYAMKQTLFDQPIALLKSE